MWFVKKKKKRVKKRVKKSNKGLFAKFYNMKLFSKSRKQTNPKPRRKKQKFKTKLIIWLIWMVLFMMVVGGIYIGYCYVTLPDFSKALYVERNRGIKILAYDEETKKGF